MIYVVTIQDKTLYGEPDIALAVVDAPDEQAAARAAYPTIEQLADAGHLRKEAATAREERRTGARVKRGQVWPSH